MIEKGKEIIGKLKDAIFKHEKEQQDLENEKKDLDDQENALDKESEDYEHNNPIPDDEDSDVEPKYTPSTGDSEPESEEPTDIPDEPIEDPTEEDPSEEDPIEEDPTEVDPSEEDPSEEDPIEEDPSEEDPSEEDPSEEDPSEEDPSEEDPIEEDQSEEDPSEEDPETGDEEEKEESPIKPMAIEFNLSNANDTLPKAKMSLVFNKDTKEYMYSLKDFNLSYISLCKENCTMNSTEIYNKNLTIFVEPINETYTYTFEPFNSTELSQTKCAEEECEIKKKPIVFKFSCTLYFNKIKRLYFFDMKSIDKVMSYEFTTLEDESESENE